MGREHVGRLLWRRRRSLRGCLRTRAARLGARRPERRRWRRWSHGERARCAVAHLGDWEVLVRCQETCDEALVRGRRGAGSEVLGGPRLGLVQVRHAACPPGLTATASGVCWWPDERLRRWHACAAALRPHRSGATGHG